MRKFRRARNRESRWRQRQPGAAENRAAGLALTARRCDVDLTSTWLEAALIAELYMGWIDPWVGSTTG